MLSSHLFPSKVMNGAFLKKYTFWHQVSKTTTVYNQQVLGILTSVSNCHSKWLKFFVLPPVGKNWSLFYLAISEKFHIIDVWNVIIYIFSHRQYLDIYILIWCPLPIVDSDGHLVAEVHPHVLPLLHLSLGYLLPIASCALGRLLLPEFRVYIYFWSEISWQRQHLLANLLSQPHVLSSAFHFPVIFPSFLWCFPLNI